MIVRGESTDQDMVLKNQLYSEKRVIAGRTIKPLAGNKNYVDITWHVVTAKLKNPKQHLHYIGYKTT